MPEGILLSEYATSYIGWAVPCGFQTPWGSTESNVQFSGRAVNSLVLNEEPLLERVWSTERGPLRRIQLYLFESSDGWRVYSVLEILRPQFITARALAGPLSLADLEMEFPRVAEVRDMQGTPHLIGDGDLKECRPNSIWGLHPSWRRASAVSACE